MARIPESEVERLKSEVSLQRLAEGSGIELKRHGADLLGLCPFHDDREPSLVISPKKNLWHCLGACQAGGTVIDWVMRMNGVSFRHACELLREGLPSLAARDRPVKQSPRCVHCRHRSQSRQTIKRCSTRSSATTTTRSKPRPEALAYLKTRGLRAPRARRALQAGLCQSHTGAAPAGEEPQSRRADATRAGSASASCATSGHEHFNGSWSFRYSMSRATSPRSTGARSPTACARGTPLHLYLPGPHRGVWNIEALQASKEVILCEALIDALTFWCAGYRNVTASLWDRGLHRGSPGRVQALRHRARVDCLRSR